MGYRNAKPFGPRDGDPQDACADVFPPAGNLACSSRNSPAI
jgi:hypothetical protein